MEARKSLAIAIAVSGMSGVTVQAEPGTWSGPYIGASAGGGVGNQGQHGGVLLLPSASPTNTVAPTTYYNYNTVTDGNYGIGGALLGGGVGFNPHSPDDACFPCTNSPIDA
jgi:hypothetical protein